VFIDCVYQQGGYDEHGVARHGCAADAPCIDTPRDAQEYYSKRFGIESSYRLVNQSLAFTSSKDTGLRLVMFFVSCCSRTAGDISTGGTWPFRESCEMVLRAARTVLGVYRAVPANQPLDDRFFR
jgi:hypothetical protein